MNVRELNREQLEELKQHYYMFEKFGEEISASWGELACIDDLVSDKEVFDYYEGFYFTEEDFCCS